MNTVPIEYVDGRKEKIDKQKAYSIIHARDLTREQVAFKKTVKSIHMGGQTICIHDYQSFQEMTEIRQNNEIYNEDAKYTVDNFSGLKCTNCGDKIYQNLSKA